ncbi:MAG: alpha/beta family hydrolase [Myxococcota bacterium]
MPNNDPTAARLPAVSLTVLLATGDEGQASDAAPACLISALESHGFSVRVIECVGGEVSTRDVRLGARLKQARSAIDGKLVLAGFSRGARVSAGMIEPLHAVAFVALAYPFHARTDPNPFGLTALQKVNVPTLLCQGTRDSHGNRQQIEGYDLPASLALHWLEDANHALRPRPSSGLDQATQLTEAATRIVDFLRSL